MPKADSGQKFDMSPIDKVVAHVIDWDDDKLSLLIDRLLQEKSKRPNGKNTDTIQT